MRIRTNNDERLVITETPWLAYSVGYGGLLGGLLALVDLGTGGQGDPRVPWILFAIAIPVILLLDRVLRIEVDKRKQTVRILSRHLWQTTDRQIPFRELRAIVVETQDDPSFGLRSMKRLAIRCRRQPDFRFGTGALLPASGLDDIASTLRLTVGLGL